MMTKDTPMLKMANSELRRTRLPILYSERNRSGLSRPVTRQANTSSPRMPKIFFIRALRSANAAASGCFDGEFQADCPRDGDESRESWIPTRRERPIQTFSLNSGRLRHLGDATARFGQLPQRNQQHTRLRYILQRRLKILGRELRVIPKLLNHRVVVGDAWFMLFHVLQTSFCNRSSTSGLA